MYKYQSLGNKFVLLENQEISPTLAQELCAKYRVDGVLVLYHGTPPYVFMFNPDGSDGQLCLNGARCVAHHLHKNHNFPNRFDLRMGKKTIKTTIYDDGIMQKIPLGAYLGEKKITCKAGEFWGHVVDVGNPHVIIFEKQTVNWLTKNGPYIERHDAFPNKTNVEFVWPTGPTTYTALMYERGCGVTQACSSGAAAIAQLLDKKNGHNGVPITITMLGGQITCWVTGEYITLHVHRAVRQKRH